MRDYLEKKKTEDNILVGESDLSAQMNSDNILF